VKEEILPIECVAVWREISNLIDGEVDDALRARMEAHFKHCKHCLAIYDGTRNVVRLVGDGAIFDTPGHLSERLYARLKDHIK
jgi:predicted anti-sigma-YlaC factor YlaD